ncbi:hypothetical protein FORC066_2168 [Yersinia enterocolitica]|nr:hypothetical protein FORC065_2312 [Yersinia enterocolitica]UXD29380.1 hypothetical protein FORC066_2168 [Yersinia enterocolitica]
MFFSRFCVNLPPTTTSNNYSKNKNYASVSLKKQEISRYGVVRKLTEAEI